MTATLIRPRRRRRPCGGPPPPVPPARTWLRHVGVMTRRNLTHIRREPMQLSDVTIQPVLFMLLFIYIFGAPWCSPAGPTSSSPSAGCSP